MNKSMDNVISKVLGVASKEQMADIRRHLQDDTSLLPKRGIIDYVTAFVDVPKLVFYGPAAVGTVELLRNGEIGLGMAFGILSAAGYAIDIKKDLSRFRSLSEVAKAFVTHPAGEIIPAGIAFAVGLGGTGVRIASVVELLRNGEIGFGAAIAVSLAYPIVKTILRSKEEKLLEKEISKSVHDKIEEFRHPTFADIIKRASTEIERRADENDLAKLRKDIEESVRKIEKGDGNNLMAS